MIPAILEGLGKPTPESLPLAERDKSSDQGDYAHGVEDKGRQRFGEVEATHLSHPSRRRADNDFANAGSRGDGFAIVAGVVMALKVQRAPVGSVASGPDGIHLGMPCLVANTGAQFVSDASWHVGARTSRLRGEAIVLADVASAVERYDCGAGCLFCAGPGHLRSLPQFTVGQALDHRFDERRRDFGIDCIAVTAQSSHACGSPMSQRECTGFNWPPLSIAAEEPISSSPEAVSRAGPIIFDICVKLLPDMPGVMPVPARSPSVAEGVVQPASGACRGRSRGFDPSPAELRWSRTTGVDQPESDDTAVNVSATPLPHRIPDDWLSSARGVGHADSATVLRELSLLPASLFPFCAGVPAIGVGQPANCATVAIEGGPVPGLSKIAKSGPAALAFGDGQPMQSLSDMRRAEARRAKIDRPEGVSRSFHVSLYSVEPSEACLACNLFANADDRAEGETEGVETGPEVPLVVKAAAGPRVAPGLAREAGSPHGTIIGPSGAAQGVAPDPDSGEEMALNKSGKIGWTNIANIPFVHDAGSDVALLDKLAQPGRGERVDLVIIGDGSFAVMEARRGQTGTGWIGAADDSAIKRLPSPYLIGGGESPRHGSSPLALRTGVPSAGLIRHEVTGAAPDNRGAGRDDLGVARSHRCQSGALFTPCREGLETEAHLPQCPMRIWERADCRDCALPDHAAAAWVSGWVDEVASSGQSNTLPAA